MEGPRACAAAEAPLLHTFVPQRRTAINRIFAAVYTSAILALLYHHAQKLLHSTTITSFSITLSMLFSDFVLAFMWTTTQANRMRPIHRKEFPQNLNKILNESDFPGLDVFICTADPYKEPPMSVVNTALSVMAYDYPTEKISVYLSDDGGSELTLFAFMEAAKFATHWLPFCRKNNLVERSPEAFFGSNHPRWSPETQNIKLMYDSMKAKVENVVERGKVSDEYITGEEEQMVFNKWTNGFTRQQHPTIIWVLLENSKHEDVICHPMPNLVYVSRQKSKTSPHYFKAGALNVLLRVSATMTNAPIVLTLDCDMYSNDPQTPQRVLCYMSDPAMKNKLAFVQFPQHFHGVNKHDIYASEYKRLFQTNPVGMDGLRGPNYVGTGCFFNRRVFFGGPLAFVSPEIPELEPNHVVDKLIQSPQILELAHRVAGCNYENLTNWGSKIGFRYGSLVEDYYTGYRLQCEGWKSIFCHPDRPAFLGHVPISLGDVLNQQKRWSIGLLEVAISKYSPITFGTRSMGLIMGLSYAHTGFWSIWSIPLTTYAFLPQLALLQGLSIFPKISEFPWFPLYGFLFLGSYGQDFLDFILAGGSVQMWWNDQRMWLIRGLTCYLFGYIEFLLKSLGISALGFNVTSKVLEDEQSKRYDQGIFEFGIPSTMFVPLAMAAIINLIAFCHGFTEVCRGNNIEGLFVQMFISGFVVVNSWPIYEAMVLRSDKGRLPTKITIMATMLSLFLYTTTSLLFTNMPHS